MCSVEPSLTCRFRAGGFFLTFCALLAFPSAGHCMREVNKGRACEANMKQIDGAVQQWALENKKHATNTYSLGDPGILANLKGSVLPQCLRGGVYQAGKTVRDSPSCSIHGRIGETQVSEERFRWRERLIWTLQRGSLAVFVAVVGFYAIRRRWQRPSDASAQAALATSGAMLFFQPWIGYPWQENYWPNAILAVLGIWFSLRAAKRPGLGSKGLALLLLALHVCLLVLMWPNLSKI